jgi:transposase InsO family protein
MAQEMVEQYDFPVRLVCDFLDLASSSYYYQKKEVAEQQLEADLKLVAGQHPTYGTRRLMHQLRRKPYGYQVNRKRVQRLARKMSLLRPVKRRKTRTTDSQHPYPRYENLVKDLEITYPDMVWVSDITYVRLKNSFVYLAIILDVFTRSVRGWCLSYSLDQQLTLEALRMALGKATPLIHHSDQGVQYAAYAYTDLLKANRIQISMAAVGKAEENGYAERFMRTIKEEEVDLSEYRDFADAYHQIGMFIQDVYMTKRIHSSLGYLTPTEFEAAYRLSLVSETVENTPF